ncbi:MAG: hypothetical protein U5K30_13305, partial [Acidimicrobiales bacterium]|nr:hypothetical protein [Acidimicrobiales bacterium]
QTDLRELQTGTGRYEHTATGHAARQVANARQNLERATTAAGSPTLSRRRRRKAEALVGAYRAAYQEAAHQWSATGHDVEQDLHTGIGNVDDAITSLEAHRRTYASWQLEHPTAARRLGALDDQIQAIEFDAGLATPQAERLPTPSIGGLSG